MRGEHIVILTRYNVWQFLCIAIWYSNFYDPYAICGKSKGTLKTNILGCSCGKFLLRLEIINMEQSLIKLACNHEYLKPRLV